MKTNKLYAGWLVVLCLMVVACTSKEVSFTYAPETPRAGQSVKFTNHTEEGEKWEWNFGDGTSSSSKSPSKIYKRPGTYTVILKVDEKAHRTCTKTITVIDTVPVIELLDDSIVYYQQPTRLHMSAYNPYDNVMKVQWTLGDDVKLLKGHLTDNTITVRFLKHSTDVSVSCLLTLANKEYPCTKAFYVNDTIAPALMMATTDGQLLRQRIFADDVEGVQVCSTSANAAKQVNSLVCEGPYTYLFNGDQTTDGGLFAYNMVDASEYRIAYNAVSGAAQGFFNGNYDNGLLYWTGSNDGHIYRVSPEARDQAFTGATTSPLYWGRMTDLHYSMILGAMGGMCWYNEYAFVNYGGTIYRFTAADLNSGVTPTAGIILAGENVQQFAIDKIAKKVYFLKADGLYVCNISGDNIQRLTTDHGTALCVDNFMNRLYWGTAEGVFYLPLVQTANNATQSQPAQLNSVAGVCAMDVDDTPRRGKGQGPN